MKIIKKHHIMCFDVDQTLVMWPETGLIRSKCVICYDVHTADTHYLLPNKAHIKLLKKAKAKGKCVIVWSSGGWEWASEVVDVLDLSVYVDIIMDKPEHMVDDLPLEKWGNRIYLEKGYGK